MLQIEKEFIPIYKCFNCPKIYDVDEVAATLFEDAPYFHIYIQTPDYKLRWVTTHDIDYKYHGRTPPLGHGPYQEQTGKKYHIRLEIDNNKTWINCCDRGTLENLLILDGFPINPSNAKKKLKTYLLFM